MPALAAILLGASAAVAPSESCSTLRWTTLGTAGGPAPTIDRSEPANLLTAGERRILVDTGDGTVVQLAKAGLDLGAIDTVFLSHLHLDHAGGLAAVIGLRWMNQFPGMLTVYGPPGTTAMVDGIVASMAAPARIGFGLGLPTASPAGSVRAVEISDGATMSVEGITVRAVANTHYDHPGGEAPGVSLSYRFERGGRAIVYTGDTGPSVAVTRLARGADLLVSEVIALDTLVADIKARRRDAPPQMLAQMTEHLATHHLAPKEVGRIAGMAEVGHVVLTHFAVPGSLAAVEGDMRRDIGQGYDGRVDLARDLSSFDVGCRP